MGTGWRYILTRPDGAGGRTFLDYELPLKGAVVTDVLSGPRALSGTISVEYERLKDSAGRPLLQERGTEIWAENNGIIRGGGLVDTIKPNGPELQVDCAGFSVIMQGEPYEGIYQGVEVDPLFLVRHMWAHRQAQQDGNLGVLVDSTTSPIRIGEVAEDIQFETGSGEQVAFEAGPYNLNWWSTVNLGAKIDDLATETPFDYHEETRWVGDDLELRLRLFYPRMGRRLTNLRFVLGENIHVIPSIERGDDYANRIVVLGAGEGRRRIRAEAIARDGRLRRTAIVQDKGLRTKTAATARAKQELAIRQLLDDISSVEVMDHPHAPIGSYSVGDEIQVQIDSGWSQANLWVRILEIALTPEDGSSATLTVERSDKI